MKPRFLQIMCASFLLANCGKLAAQDMTPHNGIDAYERHAARKSCATDEVVVLDVPLNAETEINYDKTAGRLRVFYPMQFNDLTEGWNWHPEAVAAGRDYYTYKYLPLGSSEESRGSYRNTDPTGQTQEYPIRWRHDYFFGFDNPYAFYAHDAGDAAGFSAVFAVTNNNAMRLAGGDLRMAVRGRLHANCLADSTTFWKATVSAPVDFTLKKHYLIGRLEAVWFYDAATGMELARLLAGTEKRAP